MNNDAHKQYMSDLLADIANAQDDAYDAVYNLPRSIDNVFEMLMGLEQEDDLRNELRPFYSDLEMLTDETVKYAELLSNKLKALSAKVEDLV